MLITLPRRILTGESQYLEKPTVDLARCRSLEFFGQEVTIISRHGEAVIVKGEAGIRSAQAYARRHFARVGPLWLNPAYLQQLRFGDGDGAMVSFAGLTVRVRVDLASIADAIRLAGLIEVDTGCFASLAQTLWYRTDAAKGLQCGVGYDISLSRREAVLDLMVADDWIAHDNGLLGNPAQIQMVHDDLCYYNSHDPVSFARWSGRMDDIPWFDLGEGIKINLDHVDYFEDAASEEAGFNEVTLWLDNGVSMALEREVASAVVRAAEALQIR